MQASWWMVLGALGAVVVACGGSSSQDGGGGSAGSSGSAGASGASGGAGASGSAGATSGECPSDFGAAEGKACTPEGKTCSGQDCTDCGFCSVLVCSGGKWQLGEDAPPVDCANYCGGIAELSCEADEFCDFDYETTNWCGGDDSMGVCRPRPDACPKDCPGVCGCDGKLYCNACLAHAAGVDDTNVTSCMGDGGPKICGTSSNITCSYDEFCDFADGCGAPGAAGICMPRPQGCTADCPGVCGCDGKFYCNACGANAAGVDVSESKSCIDGGV
jgi:hypothetical protein